MTDVTGLVLAGGLGRRMGEVDKGLQVLGDRPLVQWVLDALAPQVDALVINANRNLAQYRAFGYLVVTDQTDDFAGPLAGLQAGMAAATTAWIVTAPCDVPFLPSSYVTRLMQGALHHQADIAVAATADESHNVCALLRASLLPQLNAFVASGGRKVGDWLREMSLCQVSFDDQADAFRNINSRAELEEERARLA